MKILSIVVCIGVWLFIARACNLAIKRLGAIKQVSPVRIKYISKTTNIALLVGAVLTTCLLMGLGYGEVSLFLSSAFAVIGIAFFAQWSILSNITASVVIFFGFPYRVGDQIKVTDADFDLSGTLEEIGLFHVLIRSPEGNMITYPNSLILQKPVIKLDHGNAVFPQKLGAPPLAAPPLKND
ncbi:mechanosensitive ion channel family protein [Halieaceae bacterium IMCC14734]|uniref:Small-conductance mechanosensitive channel n=1 Tax=Candidatus Litorirhabdus singularis TaxID=2518993 RepID=A0ABT3TF69_9GAMM|nr:mechanosensitive ion channel domain-containing protein [Candidatus Litorirhabdus singularis]MCX2980965.1 mechanosensitive ion channel family protein [Candidatus Litorirhabdus singularis]